MPSVIAKIRNLAKYGIITDVDPYDLPTEAFSAGVNARFRNGRVSRAPVFRSARSLSYVSPRFVFATNPTSGLDLTFVGYLNGSVYLTSPNAEVDYSIPSYVPSDAEGGWSFTHLADVVYVNREDRVPWFYSTTAANFQALTGWDAAWRARLIRSCGGALVALNVTKSGTNYPTMIKTSSFPTSGSVPSSWDQTNPATNATENILAELEGPIIDAQTFGNNLVIYGRTQAWLMQKVTGFENFDYFKLPFQKGAINANCSVEIDGKHYVFGPDDMWVHDGTSEKSICQGLVRDFVFSTINMSKANRCFVSHNPALKEITFAYVSGDRLVNFMGADGCNRQAVFNYADSTWTFDDLPFVYSASYANLNVVQTYATVNATYATVGGTYLDQEDSYKRTSVYVGDANTTYGLTTKLYAFDLYGPGSTVAFAVDTQATKGLHLERDGIHLDAIEGINLATYEQLNTIYPLARIDSAANAVLSILAGAADYFGQDAVFDASAQTYDGTGLYKLDFNTAGRFLSLIIDYNDYTTVSISGFDLDVTVSGKR
jgi:hypothetical protein